MNGRRVTVVTDRDREAAWPVVYAATGDAHQLRLATEAIATARQEGRREALEEASCLCDSLMRDDCSAGYAASKIRALAGAEMNPRQKEGR